MGNSSIFALEIIIEDSLYAVKYDKNSIDEFARLFDLWTDVEYLESFFEEHKSDLQKDFYNNISIEDAIFQTIDEANELEKELIEIAEIGKTDNYENLQILFKPLNNRDKSKHPIPGHQESKVYGAYRKSWLRVYAIRITENVFIITGGAIKLTQTMNERKHLLKELDNLSQAKQFLIEQEIIDIDSIVDFFEL